MKRLITIVLALAAFAPLSANAQTTRMSDARYIAAQRCLAYADLPQLQADQLDFTALREAAAPGYRSGAVVADARENATRVRASARTLANVENGLEELRERRDTACGGFQERGLVQHGASAAS